MAARRSANDSLVVAGIAVLLGGTAAVWLAVEFGGLYDHGYWPRISFPAAGVAIRHLAAHPGDIAGAWPASEAARVPSARTFYVTLGVLLTVLLGLVLAVFRAWLRRAGRQRPTARPPAAGPAPVTTLAAPVAAPPAAEPTTHGSDVASAIALAGQTAEPTSSQPTALATLDAVPAPPAAASVATSDVTSVRQPTPAGLVATEVEPAELERYLSAAAVLRRAGEIRSTLTAPQADVRAVGIALGVEPRSGIELYGTVEDSYCLLGPARTRTGVPLLTRAVTDAPGAVLVTCPRPDTLHATAARRGQVGPVHVFDPLQLSGWPHELRWSIERGCERATTALLRASALTAAVPRPSRRPEGDAAGEVEFGPHAVAGAQTVIRCFLHALALDGRPIRHALRWMADPDDDEPVRLLRASANAADGWADELDALRRSDDARRADVWAVVRLALAPLRDPRVLAACSAPAAEDLDVPALIRDRGTLYLLGQVDARPGVAPILTALATEVIEQGRRIATRLPAGRLDPPLLLALDEAPALAPLAELPDLVATGGGLGLPPIVAMRSQAQARTRWGVGPATAMWDVATVKLVFGGLTSLGPDAPAGTAATHGSLPREEAVLLYHGLPPVRVVPGPGA